MTRLQDLSVDEALARVLALVDVLPGERAPLLEALGRVLAEPVAARDDLPPFANSAMDGYAVRAADVQTADLDRPTTLRVTADIAAGSWPTAELSPGTAARIMTGAPLPPGADAVVPVEDTDERWKERNRPLPAQIAVFRRVGVGDYVRPRGDDVRAGDLILPAGRRIRPAEISVLASLGVAQVAVVRRPRVAVLSTGDELLPVEAELTPGKIRNSNGYAQAAQVLALGAVPIDLGVAGDTAAAVRERLQIGLEAGADLFVSSAGVSVGAYDVVRDVLETEGEVQFWRVRMRPGKPLAVGRYGGVPYLGLPGNPVSAMVSFERFVRPAVLKLAGRRDLEPRRVQARVLEGFDSDGRESYIRVVLEELDGETTARPTGRQGSHLITSLLQANGLLIVPEGVRRVNPGDRLPVLIQDA